MKISRKSIIFILSVALSFAVLAAVSAGAGRMQRQHLEEQRESLEKGIERCITSCYALEGCFPPTLEYMEEHYGLHYDESVFFVDYRPVAANIRPEYFIIALEGESGGAFYESHSHMPREAEFMY